MSLRCDVVNDRCFVPVPGPDGVEALAVDAASFLWSTFEMLLSARRFCVVVPPLFICFDGVFPALRPPRPPEGCSPILAGVADVFPGSALDVAFQAPAFSSCTCVAITVRTQEAAAMRDHAALPPSLPPSLPSALLTLPFSFNGICKNC